MTQWRARGRAATLAALVALLACAPAVTHLALPGSTGGAARRPVVILLTGDMAGKVEPCG